MDFVDIKTANQTHVDMIFSLVNRAYRGLSSQQGWTSESHLLTGLRIDREGISALLNQGVILIAYQTQAIVGTVYVECRKNEGYIGLLAVDPTIQATGIGKQLLSAAEQWIVAKGLNRAVMTVVGLRTELIAFYNRRGYQATGRVLPFDCGGLSQQVVPLTLVELEKTGLSNGEKS